MEKLNIGTISKSVVLDKSKLTVEKISKEELSKASPKIVQKGPAQYIISLWGNECGDLGPTFSQGLAQVAALESVALKM